MVSRRVIKPNRLSDQSVDEVGKGNQGGDHLVETPGRCEDAYHPTDMADAIKELENWPSGLNRGTLIKPSKEKQYGKKQGSG